MGKFEERVGMEDGEEADDFLDKVGGVGVATELEEVFLNTFTHEFILLIIGKELNQRLNSMRTLLIPHNIGNILMQPLHNL